MAARACAHRFLHAHLHSYISMFPEPSRTFFFRPSLTGLDRRHRHPRVLHSHRRPTRRRRTFPTEYPFLKSRQKRQPLYPVPQVSRRRAFRQNRLPVSGHIPICGRIGNYRRHSSATCCKNGKWRWHDSRFPAKTATGMSPLLGPTAACCACSGGAEERSPQTRRASRIRQQLPLPVCCGASGGNQRSRWRGGLS